jgi:Ca2+-binding RTX toxin-like protein
MGIAVAGALAMSGVALAATIDCPNRAGNLCVGTDQADTLNGRAVTDDMRGRGGRDSLRARGGPDLLTGGPADDSLQGADGGDRYIFGGAWGDDTLTDAAGGRDRLELSAVDTDVLVDLRPYPAGLDAEEVWASGGTVDLSSSSLVEDATTGSGDDTLDGSDVGNALRAGGGADDLIGRGGDDPLDGGPGDDAYHFTNGWGADTIADPGGTDRLNFSNLSSPVAVNFPAPNEAASGADTLNFPAVAIEEVLGTLHGDVIGGTGAADRLLGNNGEDTLYGNGGADHMDGGLDNDTLRTNSPGADGVTQLGGPGNDDLGGSSGSETIDGGPGTDTVFSAGDDDVVDVADGDAGDDVDCNLGNDTVYVDRMAQFPGRPQVVDDHVNCENVVKVDSG